MKILAIDGNWYLHRRWFTLKTSRSIEEALPYAFLSMIMKDACAVKATHLLVGFDGPSVFRYKVYKEYKGTRHKNTEGGDTEDSSKEIYSYLPAVQRYLESAGIAWIQPKKYEADDVLASVAKQFGRGKAKVILGCRDKDTYQVLGPRVSIYDSALDPPEYIEVATAEAKKGVKCSQMVAFQTLIGDPTDNIPQYKTPSEAKKILKTWGSIKNWYANGTREEKLWLKTHHVDLHINRQLVELVSNLELPDLQELVVPKLKKTNMPKYWYAYQDFLYPKSRGLFRAP